MLLEYGHGESGKNRQGTGFRVFKTIIRNLTSLGEQQGVGARSDVCLEKLIWILRVQEWMGEHSRRLQGEFNNPDARDVDKRKELEGTVLRK